MTAELRAELIAAVETADVCCPEQVCDAVIAAGETGGRGAALAELERAKSQDAAERRAISVE